MAIYAYRAAEVIPRLAPEQTGSEEVEAEDPPATQSDPDQAAADESTSSWSEGCGGLLLATIAAWLGMVPIFLAGRMSTSEIGAFDGLLLMALLLPVMTAFAWALAFLVIFPLASLLAELRRGFRVGAVNWRRVGMLAVLPLVVATVVLLAVGVDTPGRGVTTRRQGGAEGVSLPVSLVCAPADDVTEPMALCAARLCALAVVGILWALGRSYRRKKRPAD